jgi:conjugal transfer pilin signal peptidase TrbI
MEPLNTRVPQTHPDAPEPSPRAPARQRRSRVGYRRGLMPALLVLGTVAINAGITLWLVHRHLPETVTFDMKTTVDRFMDQSARHHLDETASRALTARFTASLNQSLTAWQASHHALILVKPAVVSGADDITPAIQQDVARRMRTERGQP